MNKKNLFLIGLVLVLLGVYVVYFTDWFRSNKVIQVSHTTRPERTRTGESTPRLMFSLGQNNQTYELTEVKVVPLADWQNNPETAPLWHLVSDEGSDDINRFAYGEKISGMDPAVEGARPEPLKPGVKYLLLITAGKYKGQHEFQTGGSPTDISTNK